MLNIYTEQEGIKTSHLETKHKPPIYSHAIKIPTPNDATTKLLYTTNTKPPASKHHSKIRNPTTVAPISMRTPTQGVILRATYLTSLGILIALEFRPHAHRRVGVEFFALIIHLDISFRMWRLVDSRRAEGSRGLFL